MKSRNLSIVALLSLVAVLFSGCGRPKTELRLGAVLPLTGDIASYGKAAQNGIDLAIQELNQSGGIGGRKLTVVYEDDKGLPSEAANIIQKMVTVNKVPVVMGSAASSVTIAMAPIVNQHKVVLISPISSSKDLTTQGGTYFFRVCPSDAFQSVILANWIWQTGLKSVGIIYVNNSWGTGLKDEFVASYEKLGGKIVAIEASAQGDKDFRSQVTKVMSKKPDALFAPTYGIEGGILLKQVKELGVKVPIYGADVWSSPELLTSAGEAAEGVYLTLPAKPSGAKYEAFAAKFKQAFGKEPDVYAAYSYDMVEILANGLKSGNTTGERLQSYLRSMPAYDGVTGTTKFDEHGDVTTKTFARQCIKGGKYVDVQ